MMNSMQNYLKFWGTRGSCSVSGPEYSHFGGNSCCLEIRYEDTHIVIDAGTGIRPLGEVFMNEKIHKIDLLVSHTHWDHLIGFPFFDPIYHKEYTITIWAPQGLKKNGKDLFGDLLAQDFFPVSLDEIQATLKFKTIREHQPIQFGKLSIDFQKTNHPGHTLCFKITTPHQVISYVTDNEINHTNQSEFIAFHKNTDILIHEAQYSAEEYHLKTGWGHSSLDDAIRLVNGIHPSEWLVTHHDPKHSDTDLRELEKIAQQSNLCCPVQWIADGHVILLK